MESTLESGPRVDPKAYSAFIQQIELRDFWLRSATVDNALGPKMPEPGHVSIERGDSRWELIPDGFHAFHTYHLRITAPDEKIAATMAVTFGVEFSSEQTMTNELFAVFADVNLPINTWPFLREFFYTTLGRMGWVPLTLPAVKVGTNTENPPSVEKPPRRKSTRKSTQT